MTKLFELLKQKSKNQTAQGEAAKQIQKLKEQAEAMKKQVEDKLRQIQGSVPFKFPFKHKQEHNPPQ